MRIHFTIFTPVHPFHELFHTSKRFVMLFLHAFFYLLQYIRPALAAPLQIITALNTEFAPSWVDDPSGRGTWNLLYSCVFTLGLCVWSAIYLNDPSRHESVWQGWRRKVKWVVIALFAPELVVFVAFYQWLTVRCFLKELKKIAKSISSKDSEVCRYKFQLSRV